MGVQVSASQFHPNRQGGRPHSFHQNPPRPFHPSVPGGGSPQVLDPTAPGAPGAGAYGAATAGNQQQFGNTMAGLQQQQFATQQAYGIEPGFDVNNPFSKMSLLKQHYEQGRQGTITSGAAQGRLYDGSMSNALDAGRTNFNQNQDSLSRAYAAALQQISQRRIAAQTARDTGNANAFGAAVDAANKLPPEGNQFSPPVKPPKRFRRPRHGR